MLALRVIDTSGPISTASRADLAAVAGSGLPPGATTDQQIEVLQAQLRSAPDADTYANLGLTYLQKVRESGDPSFYTKADGVLREALKTDPQNFTATSGLGQLALSRHDFHAGLVLGERARRIDPGVARNYGVIADAEVELGRYTAAGRTLQKWVDLKPELSSYARVSYFRELHGDLPGALAAMQLAVTAGGQSPENLGYVQTLVGQLQLESGHYATAERAYRTALAGDPGYPAALAGLARVEAGRGQYETAITRYQRAVQKIPLPEYVIGLGETQEAAGRMTAAQASYALVGVEVKLLRANGVNTDVDLALFEANHGSAAKAVLLGRRAWAEAPSVRSADAYSWALSRAGDDAVALRFSAEAMKLGSRDPSFLYHAGIVAQRAGRTTAARGYLSRLVAQSPRFNPLYGPRARMALRELG
ncbi:MAG: tetratricopeptide repeat protein [Actinomycetota bacterium]